MRRVLPGDNPPAAGCEIRFSHQRSETQRNDSIPQREDQQILLSTMVSSGAKWILPPSAVRGVGTKEGWVVKSLRGLMVLWVPYREPWHPPHL